MLTREKTTRVGIGEQHRRASDALRTADTAFLVLGMDLRPELAAASRLDPGRGDGVDPDPAPVEADVQSLSGTEVTGLGGTVGLHVGLELEGPRVRAANVDHGARAGGSRQPRLVVGLGA